MDLNQKNSTTGNEDTVFLLRVQYRRNTSWQGTIQCLNTKKSCVFRSVLELGTLIDEARTEILGDEKTKKEGKSAWEDKESVS